MLQPFHGGALLSVRGRDGEIIHALDGFGHDAHADVAGFGDLHPHPVAGREHLEGLAIPGSPAAASESILHGILPRAGGRVAEGNVKLAVPGFLLALGFGGGDDVGLCLAGIDEPRAAEKFVRTVLEHLEKDRVDRQIAGHLDSR